MVSTQTNTTVAAPLQRVEACQRTQILRADLSLSVDVLAEMLDLAARRIRVEAHSSKDDSRGQNEIIRMFVLGVRRYIKWAECARSVSARGNSPPSKPRARAGTIRMNTPRPSTTPTSSR